MSAQFSPTGSATKIGLQKEHGLAYGSDGEWVIRVNGVLCHSFKGTQAQAREIANAIFNGLYAAGANPRWAYHPCF